MKKQLRFLTALLLFCAAFCQQLKAQGTDIVFFLDNSGSMSTSDFDNAATSIKTIIDKVLACNPNNRVSVVHFGGQTGGPYARIYIETEFTSNATLAKTFLRRSSQVGGNAYIHESLGSLGDALDHTTNSQIVSTVKSLNKTPTNKLAVFIFTDSPRNAIGSYIVNSYAPNDANLKFKNYNLFKSDKNAEFIGFQATTGGFNDATAKAALAAVSSVGGSYVGDVESNINDPEGSGTKPRKMIFSSAFSLSTTDLETLAENICSSCEPLVEIEGTTPHTQTVCVGGTPINLIVSASGTGTLTYKWYSNTTNSTTGGTLITSATSASYTPVTTTAGTLYYYVTVSDSNCDGVKTSDILTVTVDPNLNCPVSCNAGTAQVPLSGTILTNQ